MEKCHKYTVAGHSFGIILPDEAEAAALLGNYQPFATEEEHNLCFVLTLSYTEDLQKNRSGELKGCFNDEAPYFWLFDDSGSTRYGFSISRSAPDCLVCPSEDMTHAEVIVEGEASLAKKAFALNNAAMIMYAATTLPKATLMVHASVVNCEDGGFMFLGRSGTGKSTHSRQWLELYPDAELLNDDNPIVRVLEGEAVVFGSPWSGKTPCYRNASSPLKGIVRLSQAPLNRISKLSALHAYASLMPSCSCLRWDSEATRMLHETVETVISKVGVWSLECLPDKDAARVCREACNGKI